MLSVKRRRYSLIVILLLLAGCEAWNDLSPSGSDERPPVQAGTVGPSVGQIAPEFTLSDSFGNPVALSSVLPTTKAVVLYYTMWCNICQEHMNDMRSTIIPAYPDVKYYAVDYVSGSVAGARASEVYYGFDGSGITVLADVDTSVLALYYASMGTTVVIDNTGVIRMNEDYRNGDNLKAVLGSLP